MSDEDDSTEAPEEDAGRLVDEQLAATDAEADLSEDETREAEHTVVAAEGAQGRPLAPELLREVNRAVGGELILHYPARDVTLTIDGDAAIRLLTMFARRNDDRWGDALDPERSLALAGWVVLDLRQPLAMTWVPGVPTPAPRTVVDPLPTS